MYEYILIYICIYVHMCMYVCRHIYMYVHRQIYMYVFTSHGYIRTHLISTHQEEDEHIAENHAHGEPRTSIVTFETQRQRKRERTTL